MSWPFFYILWVFVNGGGFDSLTSESNQDQVSEQVEVQDSESNAEDSPEDDFDLSLFTVSEEDFEAATSGEEDGEEQVVVVNLHEVVTDETGKYAVLYFVFVLSLSPLKVIFRRNKFISALNRHRRTIGVASFFYACLHFGIYLVNGLQTLVSDLSRLYIIAGLAGFLILLILSVTSNNWSQRKLGGRKWKRLHRITYLLVPILFYHQAFAGKADAETIREALFWFSPVIILQPIRIYLDMKKRREKQAKDNRPKPA